MPNLKAAKKSLRSDARKRVVNLRRTRTMKDILKDVRTLAASGSTDEAVAKIPEAYKAIDKAVKGGIIKANNGARKKSRLVSFVKKQVEKKAA